MKLDGLLCLSDAIGNCANAVKDSQRTKTSATTQQSLVIVWGTNLLPGHTLKTVNWFYRLVDLQAIGKVTPATFSACP